MQRFAARQWSIGRTVIFLRMIISSVMTLAILFQPVSPLLAEKAASPVKVPAAAAPVENTVKLKPPKKEASDTNAVDAAALRKAPPPTKDGGTASVSALSAPQGSGGTNSPLLNPSNVKTILPNADAASGALTYDYALTIPPGRNGLQPDLKLSYNSQRTEADSVFGFGWAASIPFIERQNVDGVDKVYAETNFISSLDGELKLVSGTEWGAKIESGSFNKYIFSGGGWTVTDKRGVAYTFGSSSASQLVDPADATHIYRWYLQEVRDTNDNYIKYEYWKDGNQVFPSRIVYTGNGVTDGAFEVLFLRAARPDVIKSYKNGFLVTTSYRINAIDVKTSGTLSRVYAISFSSGSNAVRSLISGIVETGYDDSAAATTRPATSFSYQQTSVKHWNQDATWDPPYISPLYGPAFSKWNGPGDLGTRIVDINGDGLPDMLHAYRNSNIGLVEESVWINNGGGWTKDTNWDIPTFDATVGSAFVFTPNGSIVYDMGIRIADVNGDGLADFVQSHIDATGTVRKAVWINNGIGWAQDGTWTLPVMATFAGGAFSTELSSDNPGVLLTDINGDGLADFIQAYSDYNGIKTRSAWINNGHGWVEDPLWEPPYVSAVNGSSFSKWNGPGDLGTRIVDVSGDGLPDVLHAYRDGNAGTSEESVWINNGHGWTRDTSWDIPTFNPYNPGSAFVLGIGSNPTDMGVRMADANGDGLVDFVQSHINGAGNHAKSVWINNGSGWTQDTGWMLPSMSTYANGAFSSELNIDNPGVDLLDVNGDGLADFIQAYSDYYNTKTYSTWINAAVRSDLVNRVDSPYGGRSDIVYTPTTFYRNGSTLLNPNLPFVIPTVSSVSNNDGDGGVVTTNYSYAGGVYDFNSFNDRRFAGFSKVLATDAAGNVRTDFYHQGNASDSTHGEYQDDDWKMGRVYRTEMSDGSGNVYAKTINKWDDSALDASRRFVKLAQVVESVYDGDATHKDKAEAYAYDNVTGNQTQKDQYGDVTGSDDGTFVDAGTDKFTTAYSYAANSAAHIFIPSQETVTDQSAVKVKESKYYYDTQALGTVVKGNMTKQEDWKTGSSYVNTQKTYNATYGVVATSTDPNGKVTSYSYDALNLYPASVIDPMTRITSYAYDYSVGKPKQVTDPNTRVFQTVFDGLDRVTNEKQPDHATPSTLVTKTAYVYTDTAGAASVKKSDYLDSSTVADTYTYFDGLGRKLQERKEAEGANFSVTDFAYNNRGLLLKESLPYFSTGSAKTAATAVTVLYTTYSYDAVGRVTTAVDANGTTINGYADRTLNVTDANGKVKNLVKDAYGNLVEVDEHNGASTYVTTYTYDYLGGLTKITDALGNVRNFTYDGLGRRLTAEDLHAVSDVTFGAWSFVYDDAGNLTSKTDPKSQTVNYTYDNINRMLTEDYTGAAGTEVINTYDVGTDGIGRLRSTANGAVSKTLSYNALGLVSSETSTINSTNYTTTYTYTRLGGQDLVTSPDASQIKYIYNSAGLLDQVQRKETTDASLINVVSNFDYSPMGQVTTTSYSNGTTTTNTYDAAHRYRLSTKVTLGAASAHIQDSTYAYDAVGNVTQLVDASATSTSKTVAYTYDDLYRLLTATATAVAAGQSTYTQTFTYDAIGNITTGPTGTYTYAGNTGVRQENPHAVTSIGATNYTYDTNGNMLTKGTALTNTWDYNNRLIQTVAGSTTSTYSYDPSGTRIKMVDGATTTYYPTGLYNISGGTQTKHITANGITLATVTGMDAGAVVYYVATDHLTGSNIATNGSAVIQETLDYFPYGGIRIDTKVGSFSEQRKYAGKEFDATTGLSYMMARYYDASIGRFVSQDPAFLAIGVGGFSKKYERTLQSHLANPQNLNSYTYVNNNPLKYTDPSGEILPVILVAVSVYGWVSTAITAYEFKTVVIDHPEVFSEKEINQAGVNLLLNIGTAGMGHAASGIGATISSSADDISKLFFGGFGVFVDSIQNLLPQKNETTENGIIKNNPKDVAAPSTNRRADGSGASKQDTQTIQQNPPGQSTNPIRSGANSTSSEKRDVQSKKGVGRSQ